VRHRAGGKPALIGYDGRLAWFVDGRMHRAGNKPAWVDVGVPPRWAIHGKEYFFFGPKPPTDPAL
jgi:hypothetical protein